MFFPEGLIKAFVYSQPTDMRKSFNGLYSLVKNELGEDPLSGHLFVFINKRGNYLKVFYFDRTGFCIWAKKLEQGRFRWQGFTGKALQWTQLKLLLEGIELKQTKQLKRYHHHTRVSQ